MKTILKCLPLVLFFLFGCSDDETTGPDLDLRPKVKQIDQYDDDVFDSSLRYEYNSERQLSKLIFEDYTISFNYSGDRITSSKGTTLNGEESLHTYTYNTDGKLATTTTDNFGYFSENQYDNLGRLSVVCRYENESELNQGNCKFRVQYYYDGNSSAIIRSEWKRINDDNTETVFTEKEYETYSGSSYEAYLGTAAAKIAAPFSQITVFDQIETLLAKPNLKAEYRIIDGEKKLVKEYFYEVDDNDQITKLSIKRYDLNTGNLRRTDRYDILYTTD